MSDETRLPLLISVPHAGLSIPDDLQPFCMLTEDQVRADGDVGAREIYAIESDVTAFVTTDIARAVLDMNRAADDRRKDGVVKTHTCWDEVIWNDALPPERLDAVIATHHRNYHDRLTELSQRDDIVLGLDCHTMAAEGPPVGPDPGVPRPMICIGDGSGTSCQRSYVERMRDCLQRQFPGEVTVNKPFAGGYITRHHGTEIPWMQIEMARTETPSSAEKRTRFLAALHEWCRAVVSHSRS